MVNMMASLFVCDEEIWYFTKLFCAKFSQNFDMQSVLICEF